MADPIEPPPVQLSMFARYHLNVHNTPTGEGNATIEFDGPRNIVVTASAAEDNKDTLVLISTATLEPKDNVLRVFQDLATGHDWARTYMSYPFGVAWVTGAR